MAKELCSVCGQYRWLSGKARICKPCGYPVGRCGNCQVFRKIYVDGLCYLCYEHRQVEKQLPLLTARFKAKTAYNNQIFSLYLTYIRRYWLKYHHLRQTRKLMDLLENQACPEFQTWMQVYEFSEKHPLPQRCANGDAVLKIGSMLEELGVLPSRSEEQGRQRRTLLQAFTVPEKQWIEPFAKILEESRRADSTILDSLRELNHFNRWLKNLYPEANLLCVNQPMVQRYLSALCENQAPQKYLRDVFTVLNKFYRWARFEKLILKNPCELLKVSRETAHLRVCSQEQIKKLYGFIKNPEAPPEQALLLALILFYGLQIQDLRFAKIEISSSKPITLIFRQKTLSRGKRHYNRDPYLTLPTKPQWFDSLQKRFTQKWQRAYLDTIKTYPHTYLLIPENFIFNRALSYDTVKKRIHRATLAATGTEIPSKVLRQTCGHIYSRHQDASVLTRLGWSPQFAFCYTWLPRQYFRPQKQIP